MKNAFSITFMIGMLVFELLLLVTLTTGCVAVPAANRYRHGDHGDFVLNLAVTAPSSTVG